MWLLLLPLSICPSRVLKTFFLAKASSNNLGKIKYALCIVSGSGDVTCDIYPSMFFFPRGLEKHKAIYVEAVP